MIGAMAGRRPGSRLIAVGTLALALVGCGPAGPWTFELDLVEIQVTVIDETGYVEQAVADFGPRFLESLPWAVNPAERPDVLRVGWTTRACGHSTLRLEPDGDRIRLTIRTPLDARCTNDMAFFRSVRLVLDRAVDASTVDVAELPED